MTAPKDSNVIASAVMQKTHMTVPFKDGKTFSLDSSHPTFAKLKAALKTKDGAKARKMVNAAEYIGVWSEGRLTVDKNDNVLYDGKPIHPKMHTRLLKMVREGTAVSRFVKFLDNLHQNPLAETIADLYEFLEYNDLPLTEDGHFLAFKRVRQDWKDQYTGKLDNSVGNVVKMPREQCNSSRHQTCSRGLHIARYSFFASGAYGGCRTILVKVNPRDVCAIPVEYGNAKGRVCEYEVLAEVRNQAEVDELFERATVSTMQVQKTCKTEVKEEVTVVEVDQNVEDNQIQDVKKTSTTRKEIKKAKTSILKKAAQAVKKAVRKVTGSDKKPVAKPVPKKVVKKTPTKPAAKKAAPKAAKKSVKKVQKKSAKKAAKKSVRKKK